MQSQDKKSYGTVNQHLKKVRKLLSFARTSRVQIILYTILSLQQ